MKNFGKVILAVLLFGIVAGSLYYLVTDFQVNKVSLDFTNTASKRKVSKEMGYHTEPVIEFKNPTMVHLGDFTTNIIENGKPQFLKTKISLRTDSKETSEQIKRQNILIRDSVIDVLGSRRFGEVATPRGKENLKEGINEAINARLNGGAVEEVFFTEFIIQ